MTTAGTNPYHPPESDQPIPASRVVDGDADEAQVERIPSAGRRVISTIICTGGLLWMLMSLAVLIEILLRASDGAVKNQRGELLVSVLFATIGLAIFFLGVFIRRDQPRRTSILMLVILGLFILFPLIAIGTNDASNAMP